MLLVWWLETNQPLANDIELIDVLLLIIDTSLLLPNETNFCYD